MKTVKLTRHKTSDEGTMGTLELEEFQLSTAELPWRDNTPWVSCIPEGTYQVIRHTSPKFGKCLLVKNVPNRSDILFHSGNFVGNKEKGLKSDSEGCILPGLYHGKIKAITRSQDAVFSSRDAMKKLMNWSPKEGFLMEIKWQVD